MKQFLRYILTLVVILLTTTPAWAVTWYGRIEAEASPLHKGYIWCTLKGTDFDGNFSSTTTDNSTNDKYNLRSSATFTAEYYAKPIDNYKFIGWYDTNGNLKSASTNNNCYYSFDLTATSKEKNNPTTVKLYAYFVKYNPSVTTIDFGEVAYNSGIKTKTFTIDCHNVGTWNTNQTIEQGPFTITFSNRKNDDTEHIVTANVALKTTSSGNYEENLSIKTTKGGTITIKLKANINATPTYTWNPNYWNADGTQKRVVHVDDIINEVVNTTSTGTITYSYELTNPSANNNGAINDSKFVNNTATCGKAGLLKLTINQAAEPNGYNAGSDTRTILIEKYDITASINPDNAVWNQLVTPNPFSASTQHKFSGATSAVTDFTVTQQNNEHIAKLNNANYTIQTYYTSGDVNFLITRPEDYKYNALSKTLTLDVNQSTVNCSVLEDSEQRDWKTINNSGIYEIPSGAPDSLFFQARRTDILGFTNTTEFYAEYSSDNNTWTEAMKIDLPDQGTWYDLKCDIPETAKYVRFITYVGATGKKHIRNVQVTRKAYLRPSTTELTLPQTSINKPSQNTFNLSWSTCSDDIKLMSNNDLFEVETTQINTTAHTGTTNNIVVHFKGSNQPGIHEAVITIYDQSQSKEVHVSCEVKEKLATRIVYTGEYQYAEVQDCIEGKFYVLDETETRVAGANIVLESSNNGILEICGNAGFKPHCGGSVTLTAKYVGDETHAAANDWIGTIQVANCYQTIVWNQTFMGLTAEENGYINEPFTLNAHAATGAGLPTNQIITYELDAEAQAIASLSNNNGTWTLNITGVGTGKIYATAAPITIDGISYDAAVAVREIRVRKEGDPCHSTSLKIENEVQFHGWFNDQITYELKGLPDSPLEFYAHTQTGSLNNQFIVDFSKDGSNWIGKKTFNLTDKYDWNKPYTCDVPDSVKYVRFETGSSMLTYFNMATIYQKTYITPSVSQIVISDAVVNQPFEFTFTVDYSDVPYIQDLVTNANNLDLKLTRTPDAHNDCGMYGTYSFTLTGMSPYPQENATETITLYTSAGDEVKIPVIVTSHLSDRYDFNLKDGNWNDLSNWQVNGSTPATLPTPSNPVYISKAVTIQDCEAIAFSITMVENGGHINVAPTGGLTVHAGGFTNANENNLLIHNTQQGAGFVRISKYFTHEVSGTMPRATINYQTRSTLDTGADKDATWQYFGAPGDGCQFTVDYITWLYQWSEPENWLEKSGTLTLAPFAGYAITQYGQPTYSLVAQPIHSNQDIVLTKTPSGMKGDNLFANSYMAPIDVKNFTAEDFSGDLDKTFYIFNSGSWNQWNRQNEKDSTLGSNGSTTPGQYCAIPALSSQYLDSQYDITTIPPMQGVYVIANENGATIHLNYHKHVWQAGSYTGSSTDMHEAMRAPQRQAQEQMQQDDFRRLRLQVNSANSGADRMYIIQESTTTRDYDNGYDAPNQLAEGIANIYTNEHFGKMEVSCANNIDSMYIGFQAGIDSLYTLSYRSIIGPSIYLKDLSNDSTFLLVEGGQYQFATQPLSTDDMRFQVLLSPILNDDTNNNEGTTTDLSQLTNADIWFADNQLYISNAPANSTIALYHINGQLIVSSCIQQSTHTISLDHLQQGVYLLRLNHQMYKFVRQ